MEELNNFKEALSTLDVNENSYIINPDSINVSDPIEKDISKYKFHRSILLVNDKGVNQDRFSFKPISKLDMEKEVQLINPKNATTSDSIPPKILKISSQISVDSVPKNLKFADITLIFKVRNSLHKVNYRPVDVSLSISKVFQKLMQKVISCYISNYLSPYLCGYRKGFSSQQALMSLIENWKRVLDKKGFGGAVLMDLSKAFDTIKHDLLIVKLYAYSFSKELLKLLHSYMSNRWHRTKINK